MFCSADTVLVELLQPFNKTLGLRDIVIGVFPVAVAIENHDELLRKSTIPLMVFLQKYSSLSLTPGSSW